MSLLQKSIRLPTRFLGSLLGQAVSFQLLGRGFENFLDFRFRRFFIGRLVLCLVAGAAVDVDVNGTEVFAVYPRRGFPGRLEVKRGRPGLEKLVQLRATLSTRRRQSDD